MALLIAALVTVWNFPAIIVMETFVIFMSGLRGGLLGFCAATILWPWLVLVALLKHSDTTCDRLYVSLMNEEAK